MTELLTKNAKMAKSSGDTATVYNFGIPAYQSASGLRTCPSAGTCAKGCYATQGAYAWSNVAQAYEWRLEQTQKPDFIPVMVKEIRTKLKTAQRQGKQLYIRIHDSGDFYSIEYLANWLEIMRQVPEAKFYAYTKQVRLFKAIIKAGAWQIPSNFTVIYSFGGIHDQLIDKNTDRHSAVFESESELLEAGYSNAMENDLIACGANHKVGLVYHGAKVHKFVAKGA